MYAISDSKAQLAKEGFAVMDQVYTNEEVDVLLHIISKTASQTLSFCKTTDLFAIRQFFKEVPAAVTAIFTSSLKAIIGKVLGADYFVVKSIYFDKPAASNWFVAYHQDLTIAVADKAAIEGFGPWTKKGDAFAVQPPLSVLEKITTIRIHLDATDQNNGALKVIPGSHTDGIWHRAGAGRLTDSEISCCVPKGGIMFMKPLLLHASGRTTNQQQRRVIHIEFSNQQLPQPLIWSEYFAIR